MTTLQNQYIYSKGWMMPPDNSIKSPNHDKISHGNTVC